MKFGKIRRCAGAFVVLMFAVVLLATIRDFVSDPPVWSGGTLILIGGAIMALAVVYWIGAYIFYGFELMLLGPKGNRFGWLSTPPAVSLHVLICGTYLYALRELSPFETLFSWTLFLAVPAIQLADYCVPQPGEHGQESRVTG